ncbi:MAG TPA: DUF3604 domain-containing protein [Bryobacteraceae bacterium]|nr:DUF3604 domain-containing protein [Bryobacteraceae bacterium]
MKRTTRFVSAVPAVAAAVMVSGMLFSQSRPGGRSNGSNLLAPSVVSFLVQFGVTDIAPRDWDGSVTASNGGEIVNLRDWHPRPDDEVTANKSWKLKTRPGLNFEKRPWESEVAYAPVRYLLTPGLIVDVKATGAATLRFETRNGAFTVQPTSLRAGQPARYLNGAVTVELVPGPQLLSTKDYENDFASALSMPNGDLWVAWIGYRNRQDTIFARRLTNGEGSAAEEAGSGDIAFTKLGRDRNGGVWVFWSQQVESNFDVYGRRFDGKSWGRTERLSDAPQPDIYPAVATDSSGNLWLAWQGFRNGKSDIFARRYDGSSWSAPEQISTSPANDWEPALAADGAGHVYAAWDTYDKGNYDVMMRRYENGQWSQPMAVAATPRYEAHVSLACDKQNRLWAAWNYSGMQWGKDAGFLVKNGGTWIYEWRAMGVAVYANGQWQEPVADINASLPADLQDHDDLPILQADGSGRMWVFFRHRFAKFRDVPNDAPAHRAAWEIYGIAYDGDRWSTPVPFPFSQGRTDMRVGFTADSRGQIYAAWPMDNRDFQEFLFQHADVYAGRVPLPGGEAIGAKLRPYVQPEMKTWNVHMHEKQDLGRIRGYAIEVGGKTYHIYRGDTHRHSEFSFDGNNDGSIQETYRYAIDAASLDYLGLTDHNQDGGPDVDYINWLEQQTADLYFLPNTFTSLFAYERSVVYPNGHRNVLFAERGNPTLPIPQAEQKGLVGAKALYAYLKRLHGISIPHTSATSMGTDWRDNDPAVEPLVEIYQGDRVSAEYEGAPKAANGGNMRSAPGGFKPAGYVWNAWAKGYKLGVQASSDHLSTHISYACTLATGYTRPGLLDAMRQRHSYAATDNIVLDYRLQTDGHEYMQGDIVKNAGSVKLVVKAIGTAPIRQIDIIRSNRFVHNLQPMQPDVNFTYVDDQPLAGESYYYVRLIQVDDQMAWSSPIWVSR